VAGQVALAIVLLTGAGLMIKSFWRMNAHPPGFHPERILLVQMKLAGPGYRDAVRQRIYFEELLGRMQKIPGVEAAGILHTVARGPIERQGTIVDRSRKEPRGAYNIASAAFGRVLGIPLVKGRWLTDHEPAPVVMINESYARMVFGDLDPIGQKIMAEALAPAPATAPATVIGVIGDLRYTRLDAASEPEVYLPYLQSLTFRARASWCVPPETPYR
jgi:putative ABC transport system permease protein